VPFTYIFLLCGTFESSCSTRVNSQQVCMKHLHGLGAQTVHGASRVPRFSKGYCLLSVTATQSPTFTTVCHCSTRRFRTWVPGCICKDPSSSHQPWKASYADDAQFSKGGKGTVALEETILDPHTKSDMSHHMARYGIVSQDRAVKKKRSKRFHWSIRCQGRRCLTNTLFTAENLML
jgi:hypothetical protein